MRLRATLSHSQVLHTCRYVVAHTCWPAVYNIQCANLRPDCRGTSRYSTTLCSMTTLWETSHPHPHPVRHPPQTAACRACPASPHVHSTTPTNTPRTLCALPVSHQSELHPILWDCPQSPTPLCLLTPPTPQACMTSVRAPPPLLPPTPPIHPLEQRQAALMQAHRCLRAPQAGRLMLEHKHTWLGQAPSIPLWPCHPRETPHCPPRATWCWCPSSTLPPSRAGCSHPSETVPAPHARQGRGRCLTLV